MWDPELGVHEPTVTEMAKMFDLRRQESYALLWRVRNFDRTAEELERQMCRVFGNNHGFTRQASRRHLLCVAEKVSNRRGEVISWNDRVLLHEDNVVSVLNYGAGLILSQGDGFAIPCSECPFHSYYNGRYAKGLIFASNTRHLLFVSHLYPATMHEAAIFDAEFPDGLPELARGRTLGDTVFSRCRGWITPPTAVAFRSAIFAGDEERLNHEMERYSVFSRLRAYMEHVFNNSGLSASRMANPVRCRQTPPLPELTSLFHAWCVAWELDQLYKHGYGGVTVLPDAAELTAIAAAQEGAIRRYEQKLVAYREKAVAKRARTAEPGDGDTDEVVILDTAAPPPPRPPRTVYRTGVAPATSATATREARDVALRRARHEAEDARQKSQQDAATLFARLEADAERDRRKRHRR